jgi:hypothetical protein
MNVTGMLLSAVGTRGFPGPDATEDQIRGLIHIKSSLIGKAPDLKTRWPRRSGSIWRSGWNWHIAPIALQRSCEALDSRGMTSRLTGRVVHADP